VRRRDGGDKANILFVTERHPHVSEVSGLNSTGTALYRAAFAPVSSYPAWDSQHGMTCQAYKTTAASLASEGYATAWLQSYVSNDGTRRYQATWVKW
jgi:hypothetical protein